MCRDLNLHALQGVIFDHACGLDQYILNREPAEFEYLRCLVDGAHWQVNLLMLDHPNLQISYSKLLLGTEETQETRQIWWPYRVF